MNNRQNVFSLELNPEKCLTNVPFLVDSISEEAVIHNVTTMTRRFVALTDNPAYKKLFKSHLKKHLSSNYSGCNRLKQYLTIVVNYLEANADDRMAIIDKLIEGITNCTPGFDDRVYIALCAIYEPSTIDQLLALLRRYIVEKIYRLGENKESSDGEVHTHHRYFVLAQSMGYAIYGDTSSDPHQGLKSNEVISEELAEGFLGLYTPSSIVDTIWDESPLSRLGYTGKKEAGYQLRQFGKIVTFFKTIFSNPGLNVQGCFIIEEDDRVTDINWLKINSLLLSYLYQNNYIKPIEDAEVCEFEESGQVLRFSYPRNDISKGRISCRLTGDNGIEEYHLLFSSMKCKDDLKRLPYPLLRKLLINLVSRPSLPAQILGMLEQLVDPADNELEQFVNTAIINRITQQELIELVENTSLPRLIKVRDANRAEVQRRVASIPLTPGMLSLKSAEKCAFVADLFSARLRHLFFNGQGAAYVKGLSTSSSEEVYKVVQAELIANMPTSVVAKSAMLNLNLNLSRAMCKVLSQHIQTLFPTIESVVGFLAECKDRFVSAQELPFKEARHLIIYRTLREKILGFIDEWKQLPVEVQLVHICDLLSGMASSAQAELMADIKEYSPALVTSWESLGRIAGFLQSESALTDFFQRVKNNPACTLGQEKLTLGEFRQFCYQNGSRMADAFCDVFESNIVATFAPSSHLIVNEIFPMTEEQLKTFCSATKSYLGTLLDGKLIFLTSRASKWLLKALDNDISCLVVSPECIRYFAGQHIRGNIEFLKSALKGAAKEKIKNMQDFRLWCEKVETPAAADILYYLISDYFFDKDSPLIRIPGDVLRLLSGDSTDLWMAALIIRSFNDKDLRLLLPRLTRVIKQNMSKIENVSILLSVLDKSRSLKILNALESITCNHLDFGLFYKLLAGKPTAVKEKIVEKLKLNLVGLITGINSLPLFVRERDSQDKLESSDLIFAAIKEKVSGYVTSFDDLISLSERLRPAYCAQIVISKINQIKAGVKTFQNLYKIIGIIGDKLSTTDLACLLSNISDISFDFKRDTYNLVGCPYILLPEQMEMLMSKIQSGLINAFSSLDIIREFKGQRNFILREKFIFKPLLPKMASLVTSTDDLKMLHGYMKDEFFREFFPVVKVKLSKIITTWAGFVEMRAMFTMEEMSELLQAIKSDPLSPLFNLEIELADYELLYKVSLNHSIANVFPNKYLKNAALLNGIRFDVFTILMPILKSGAEWSSIALDDFINIAQGLSADRRDWLFEKYKSHHFLKDCDSMMLFYAKLIVEMRNESAQAFFNTHVSCSFFDLKNILIFAEPRYKNASLDSFIACVDLIFKTLDSLGSFLSVMFGNEEQVRGIVESFAGPNKDVYTQLIKLLEQHAILRDKTTFDLPAAKRSKKGNDTFLESDNLPGVSAASTASGYSPTLFPPIVQPNDDYPLNLAWQTNDDDSLDVLDHALLTSLSRPQALDNPFSNVDDDNDNIFGDSHDHGSGFKFP